MGKRLQKYIALIIALAAALLLCVSVYAANDTKTGKVVRVGHIGYEGFIEEGSDGRYKGYGVAYLNRISQYTGWKYEYVYGSWEDILDQLERGEIDLVCTAQKTEEREKRFDFSSYSIGNEETVIYTRKDNDDIYYQDYEHMDGKVIAMFREAFQNDEFIKYASEKGFRYHIKMYSTEQEILDALARGETDMAVLGSLSIHKNLKIVDRFNPAPYYFMTTKGNTDIVTSLDEALKYINSASPYLQESLYRDYYGAVSVQPDPTFTREEVEYVKAAEPLTIACLDDYYPLSYRNEDTGEPDGIFTAIVKKIGEISGLKMKFVSVPSDCFPGELILDKKADLVSGVLYSHEMIERPEIQLTDTFITQPAYLVAKTGVNMYDLENPVIALPTSCRGIQTMFPDRLQKAEIIYKDSLEECFAAVNNGEAAATVQSIYVASYFLQMNKYHGLSLTDFHILREDDCLMAPADADRLLMSILNKSISCLDDNTINQMIGEYSVSRPYQESFWNMVVEYRVEIIGCIAISLMAFTLIFVYNYRRTRIKYELREKEIYKKKAETDDLTGLLNRSAFFEQAQRMLKDNPWDRYWILYIDVENFKVVNDLFGAKEGDKLLCYLADCAREWAIMRNGICSRFEADHFVILITGERDSLIEEIRKVRLEIMEYPLEISIKLCCGMYEVNDRTKSIDIMCDRAHLAANSIKGNHLQHAAVYDDSHREKMVYEQMISSDMENALRNDEFLVYLQPKFNMVSREIIGAEALVRWQHPTRGLLNPGDFISIFEKNGTIGQLDLYMFEKTCILIKKWREEGKKVLPVSVNLSRASFYNPKLCDNLCRLTEKYGIPASLLELEVTETAYAKDADSINGTLIALRTQGFRILMDDFGSGYSSLNMLKEAPIDEIKLDMRFLNVLDPYGRAEKILRTIIAMGNDLGLSVLAEGVENEQQAAMLRGFSCWKTQGYYYSRPVEAQKYAEMLEKCEK